MLHREKFNATNEPFRIDITTANKIALRLKMSAESDFPCQENVENVSELQEQLYNSVLNGGLDNALNLTDTLHRSGNIDVINNIISRLLYNGTPNIMGYAYRLWLCNHQELIYGNFPPAFKLIFNGDLVTITNKEFGLPMKLQIGTDKDNDRRVWCDGERNINNRMKWKFSTIWENNTLYCKIKNAQYNQFLKIALSRDDMGDREIFGAPYDDTHRHYWCLRPVMDEGNLLFYIINRQYGQALKLGRWQDSNNDRLVWGRSGSVVGLPVEFGWSIEQVV
ncbi:hypothetical protein K1T71_003498 [Dendrolimus kikuchii]|uniref:Uncharacterized protein n=1 Tax=Dendrolimus kikuchii TaxID=765133 RepID=A0ACC1DBV8_9NEOP|nr:hypothetical protein K1T71_003498 [Dendrolimus kikuchii]